MVDYGAMPPPPVSGESVVDRGASDLIGQILMTFAAAGAPTARVLGGYLQALDEYYTATVTTHIADGVTNVSTQMILDNPTIFEADPDAIERSSPLEHSYELTLERAEYKSPLLLALSGCLSALTVAVIVSGGKISFGPNGLMADLPPLGVGLRRLKEALRRRRR
jgi:hypothetical protein